MKRKTNVRSYERRDGTKVQAHERSVDATSLPKTNTSSYKKPRSGVIVDTVSTPVGYDYFFAVRDTLLKNGYKRSGSGDGVVIFNLYKEDYSGEPFIGMIESDLDGGNGRLSAKFTRASLAFDAARMTVENDPTKRVLLVDLKSEDIIYVELPGGGD